MKGLPDISEQISNVLQHYTESITTTYPNTNARDDRAITFTKAWLELQFENGLTEYYHQRHKH